ncbi:MAG TPA: PEP-CTERM sorting domain-containing protein [Pirellulales bacterium]|jgi:T5SS/PEP-CTERM-associated repeat protein|nr:PEP-CTERM sorting domain-containing protein [Pirellulales bacterium]
MYGWHGYRDCNLVRMVLETVRCCGLTALIGLGLLAGNGRAMNSVWTPQSQPNLEFPLDASWFDGSNWSAGFPGASDRAVFNAVNPPPNSPFRVYFGDFNKQIINPPQTIPFAAGTATVAALDVQNNTWVFNFDAFNAPPNAATGNLTVTGAGSFVIGSLIDGGGLGGASLTVTGSGTLTSNGASLGLDSATSGTVILTGSSTLWNDSNSNGINVGVNGLGTLNVNNGAQLNANLLTAAAASGSVGDISINGGTCSGPLTLGGHGQASLTVNSGGASLTNVNVALFSDSTATITVTGASSTLDASTAISLGTGGHGTLNIGSGAQVTTPFLSTALASGSVGDISLSGAGSQLNVSNSLSVGTAGQGTLTIGSGAQVTTPLLSTAAASGSVGDIVINGGTLSSGLSLGGHGQSSLTINSGAAMLTNANVALSSDSTATITVTGANSSLNASSALSIGSAGHGTLNINNGAQVTTPLLSTALASGAIGDISLSGAGSQLNVSNSLSVGTDGQGTLTIGSGAQVTTPLLSTAAASGSVGDIVINGGTLSGGLSLGGHGQSSLTINSGAAMLTNANVALSSDSTATITVTGANSSLNASSALSIGNAGHGTLNINNGAQVTTPILSTAAASGSVGNVVINGGTFSGGLTLGGEGQSSLTITSGTASITGSNVALDADSTASITVSGPNSKMDIAQFLAVATGGRATAQFSGGAAVTGQGGALVGASAGSQGDLTITDAGTTWTIAEQMDVGNSGAGSLTIAAGAVFSTGSTGSPTGTSGVIGGNTGGTGTVTVTGAGSTWTQNGGLSVGFDGQGTMMVEAGGLVHSASGYVGRFSGAVGHATVTGTNSTWNVDGSLFIASDGSGSGGSGSGGNGSLVVASNGAVTVGSELQIGAQGTVNVTGGRMAVGSGGLPAAAGTLHVGPNGLLEGIGTIIGHVVNDGSAKVAETSRIMGGLDGTGITQVNAGGSLTADHIIQNALFVGGASGSPALVTIDASDSNGNPLASDMSLAGSLSPSDPFGAGLGSSALIGDTASSDSMGTDLALSLNNPSAEFASATVPEPTTIVLLAIAMIGLLSHERKTSRFAKPRNY